jgi:ATP-dependent Clp protease ATP-binding subunit ClpB
MSFSFFFPSRMLTCFIDVALARRFQPIQVNEPNIQDTISILRGIKEKYEVHHGVRITDGALVAAATYSNRYITDRFLPDKAIDLMDEAASALRLQQETDIASKERREKLQSTLKECQEEAAKLTEKWEKERAEIDAIKKTKEDLEKARIELDQAQVRLVDCTHPSIF